MIPSISFRGKALSDQAKRGSVAIMLSLPLAAVFFVGVFLRYGGAGHDDEYIFLWAGRSLNKYPWFANVNGDLEDMVSSPLTGLIAWLADWLAPHASLITFKLMGLAAATTVLPLVALCTTLLIGYSVAGRVRTSLTLLTVLTVALVPTFGYWAMGGMETPFQALALILLGITLAAQTISPGVFPATALAIATTMVVLLRLEGLWVLLLVLLVLAHGRPQRRLCRSDVTPLAVPAIAFLLLAFLRHWYTGAIWPNPVYAKGGELAELLPLGINYVWGFALSSPMAALLQLVSWGSFVFAWTGKGGRQFSRPEEHAYILALSGLAVGQDLFTIFAGGNWMTFYRFLAPSLPLKIILLTWVVAHILPRCRPPLAAAMLFSFVILALGQLLQSGRNPNYPNSLSVPKPLWPVRLDEGLQQIQQQIILSNVPHARDELHLRPFIMTQLPRILKPEGPLCIATYQAGYFPWMLREILGPESVRIADTLGLNDRLVAQRPGPRNPLGLANGEAIDLLLLERDPALQKLCNGAPDLVYVLSASDRMHNNMNKLGYQLLWNRPGAVIFKKM